MTPTLFGRWQTRLATLGTLGVIVTAIFFAAYKDERFFLVLGYITLFGIGWDVIWIALQKLRWDRDWPAAFQVVAGVVEGVLVYSLIRMAGLPWIETKSVAIEVFTAHYGAVWLVIFIWVQGPMRALFPRWRFSGGRII